MPKGILLVRSAPSTPERDAEYNDWYNDVHLVDVLKLAGFTSARRFKMVDPGGEAQPYLAIYEVDADDLQAAFASLGPAAESGEMPISDVLGMDPAPSVVLFEQLYELTS